MRTTIALLFCLVTFWAAQAQQTNLDKLNWKQNLELANDLYARNSYYNAIGFYEKVIRDKPDHLAARYNLAESYRHIRHYGKAENLYRFFTPQDSKTYPLAVFHYAMMLKANGKHGEALAAFKIFVANPYGAPQDYINWANVQISGCEQYGDKPANMDITVKHAGGNLNGSYPNFGALYAADGSVIFSSIASDTALVIQDGATMPDVLCNLYRAKTTNTSFGAAEPLNSLNSAQHTANGSFSPDGKLFFFTHCVTNDKLENICDIYVSKVVGNNFETPVKLPESVNRSGTSNTQPSAGLHDGSSPALYFASNRDGGKGGFDIWVVDYNAESMSFGNASPLSEINTVWDEVSPFYHANSNTLYFSSNGHPGVGGLDVFSTREVDGNWEVITHLDKPINTSADDWYFTLDKGGMQGFVSSNREGSISLLASTTSDDIYTVNIKKTVNYYGYVYQLGDTNEIALKGVTITLYEKNATTGKFEEVVGFNPNFDAKGQFNIPLKAGKDYKMIASKAKYLNNVKQVSKQEIDLVADGKKFITFTLDKIEKDKVYKLDNIYYDYNSANLRDSSKLVLDGLLELLTTNPHIVIELSSHTDSRGGADYNKTLSQQRAESCTKYLIEKGIAPNRLVAMGYGEEKLLNECGDKAKCTEEQHQVNRRTEFKVIGELEEGSIIKQ